MSLPIDATRCAGKHTTGEICASRLRCRRYLALIDGHNERARPVMQGLLCDDNYGDFFLPVEATA